MLKRTVVINPIEPALLSVRSPLGLDLDLSLTFLAQDRSPVDPAMLMPQLALLPRSALGVFAYDVETTGGAATVSVPGSALVDFAGYNLELYQRREAVNPSDPLVPIGLLAKGVLRLEGSAYVSWGPLSPLMVPVVVGPPGPAGAPGLEGPVGPPGAASTVPGPKGDPGPANVLTIGTVTTGAPGTPAAAIITGTSPNQTISFTIPQGLQGLQGLQGIPGTPGTPGAPGAPAVNLLSGPVDPTPGVGNEGDFWVNTVTGSLFGPKTGSAWPVVELTTYWA